MELRDNAIVLRPWRMDDTAAVFAACQDSAMSHWIPWIPRPFMERASCSGRSTCISTGNTSAATSATGSPSRRAVAASPRGRSGCSRTRASKNLELQRLELITDPGNIASQRVAEKVGFVREGVLRSHLRHPDGRVRDSVMFSLLPGELR